MSDSDLRIKIAELEQVIASKDEALASLSHKYRIAGDDQTRLGREKHEALERVEGLLDEMELAWGIIANAGGGDWTKQTEEWQIAAARWRDRYFELVPNFHK